MQFRRTEPIVGLEHFLERAKVVTYFTSSNGRRYKVIHVENDLMTFLRLDAKKEVEWDINLEKVYQAYIELKSFNTISFKQYVPKRHSPARGLLLYLEMLEPVS